MRPSRDHPKTIHSNKTLERYGKEASNYTKRMLTGAEISLQYENGCKNRDPYGHIPAYAFKGGKLFN